MTKTISKQTIQRVSILINCHSEHESTSLILGLVPWIRGKRNNRNENSGTLYIY